jgi:hypothetical protein
MHISFAVDGPAPRGSNTREGRQRWLDKHGLTDCA